MFGFKDKKDRQLAQELEDIKRMLAENQPLAAYSDPNVAALMEENKKLRNQLVEMKQLAEQSEQFHNELMARVGQLVVGYDLLRGSIDGVQLPTAHEIIDTPGTAKTDELRRILSQIGRIRAGGDAKPTVSAGPLKNGLEIADENVLGDVDIECFQLVDFYWKVVDSEAFDKAYSKIMVSYKDGSCDSLSSMIDVKIGLLILDLIRLGDRLVEGWSIRQEKYLAFLYTIVRCTDKDIKFTHQFYTTFPENVIASLENTIEQYRTVIDNPISFYTITKVLVSYDERQANMYMALLSSFADSLVDLAGADPKRVEEYSDELAEHCAELIYECRMKKL